VLSSGWKMARLQLLKRYGKSGEDVPGKRRENEFAPVTPGEMLREEFLKEYGL